MAFKDYFSKDGSTSELLATTTDDGLISAADKTKLDGLGGAIPKGEINSHGLIAIGPYYGANSGVDDDPVVANGIYPIVESQNADFNFLNIDNRALYWCIVGNLGTGAAKLVSGGPVASGGRFSWNPGDYTTFAGILLTNTTGF
jgi:hypothetical protein